MARSSTILRRAVLGLFIVPVLVISGCSDDAPTPRESTSTTPPNIFEATRNDGVDRLLDSLTNAITSGDEGKLNSLIDASATREFRQELVTATRTVGGKSAASARGKVVRYKTFRYRLGTADAELVLPSSVQTAVENQGASDTWFAPVKIDYALGGEQAPGLDEPDIQLDTPLALARYGDDWKIIGDSTLLDGAPVTAPRLWSYPGLQARDAATVGGTSVVLSYPGTDAAVPTIARELPAAVLAVTKFWGNDWARRAAVVATATDEEFRGLAGSEGAVGAAAAATIYATLDTAAKTASGQRVILTPAARDLPAPALAVVLRHELTHVAVRPNTVADAPLWLTEGVPEYVGRKGTYQRFEDAAPDLAAVLRGGEIPIRLPDDRDFAVDKTTALVAYQSAWSLAAFVAQTYGEARLKALYLGVGAADKTEAQDLAIVNTLRLSRAQFVARWQDWLRKQMR